MADEQVVGSPEREIHVQALVQLEKIDLKKQEENEEELFKMRAKLYRFFTEKDETGWKERGLGEIKIMKHKAKGTFRIVMRREKTLKLCANHAIVENMEIKPHMGGEKALVWSTMSDFADDEAKAETLCVRFGKAESATEFKEKFEECVKSVKNKDNSTSDKLAEDLSSLKVNDEKDSKDQDKNKDTEQTNGEKESDTKPESDSKSETEKPKD